MRSVSRRGFSVIELIVALVLTAIVATAALRAFLGVRSAYGTVGDRLEQNAVLRDAAAVLPYELRALGSGPGAASQDLTAVSPTSVTYRATANLFFACETSLAPTRRLVLDAARWYGVRSLDPARDSVLVLTVDTAARPVRGTWVAADLSDLRGTLCPGGDAGVEVTLSRPIAGVESGTPLQGFQLTEMRLYRDRTGERWIGARTARKVGGWSATQPILGPVDVDGLQVVAYDRSGAITRDAASAVRLGATVTARATRRSGAIGVVLQIALRNSRR